MSTQDLIVARAYADWLDTHRPFVLATVVQAVGSVPRHAGAKMLVPLEGEPVGTVGGGAVEHAVIEEARRMLVALDPAHTLAMDLAQESACGGRIEVFLEPHRASKRIVIIGAGHVCAAVAPLLVRLGWDVTVLDPRGDRLELPEYRHCRRVRAEFATASAHIPFAEDLFILVMSPQHTYDAEVADGVLGRPWRWLGIIGSKRKAAQMKAALAARGHAPEIIARLRCPVGIEIGSDTPDEIAVSIAAELIRETAPAKKSGT
jgi:xanthine dehydrogenase accessory factor